MQAPEHVKELHEAAQTTKTTAHLTREDIQKKALEMADREGIENLSARKLAKELGKTPMALYRHYASIDQIRQAALALAYEEIDLAPIPGERWDDTVRRTASSIRHMYLNHSSAHLHLMHVAAWDPGMIRHTERMQKLHADQNIPPEIFSRMWRVIDAFLKGFINAENNASWKAPETAGCDREPWAETVESAYTTQAFEDGIEIIIGGIRTLAAPDPCEWRTPKS